MSERKNLAQLNFEAAQVNYTLSHVFEIVAQRAEAIFPLDAPDKSTLEELLESSVTIGTLRSNFLEELTTVVVPQLLGIQEAKTEILERAKDESEQALTILQQYGIFNEENVIELRKGINSSVSYQQIELGKQSIQPSLETDNPIPENSKSLEQLTQLREPVRIEISPTSVSIPMQQSQIPEAENFVVTQPRSLKLDGEQTVRETSEKDEGLPTFILHPDTMEVECNGKRRFTYWGEWKILMSFANDHDVKTLEALALTQETKSSRKYAYAEDNFKKLLGRYEKDPREAQIFVVTGGKSSRRFEIKANIIIAKN